MYRQDDEETEAAYSVSYVGALTDAPTAMRDFYLAWCWLYDEQREKFKDESLVSVLEDWSKFKEWWNSTSPATKAAQRAAIDEQSVALHRLTLESTILGRH